MWNFTEQHKNLEKIQLCRLNERWEFVCKLCKLERKSWKFDTKTCVTFANSLETVDLKLCAKPSEASSWNCHPHFLLHPPTNRAENQQRFRLCIWLCICLYSCIWQKKLRMIKFRSRLRSRTNAEINLLSASITPLSRDQRRISFKTKCVKCLLKKNSFAL